MTDLTNLPIGTRVVWSKMDPHRGNYDIAEEFFGKGATIIGKPAFVNPDSDHSIDYPVDFDGSVGETWYLLSTMIELESGPW